MADPFGIAARLRAQGRDFGAGIAALRDWRAMTQATEQVWHMVHTGGVMICTPPEGKTLIATLIQPDGDVMLSMSRELLGPDHVDDRKEIAWRHCKRVRATMAPLERLARNGQALELLLLLARRDLLGVGALYGPFAGGALYAGFETPLIFSLSAGTPFAMAALPWLLRRQAGRFMRRRVRRRLDALRDATHEAHAGLVAPREP